MAATGGASYFTSRDHEQITVAAFLNVFIAWEEFIEASIGDFMMGEATMNGGQPVRYVTPPTRDHAGKMVIHMNRYFDYANHENIKKLANLYFDTGYPFNTPINSLTQELSDLKIMRNACAHMSSTTKAALEGLGLRIFGSPQAGITVYQMLTAEDPRTNPKVTVFAAYCDKLLVTAELVALG
nr:hypothetical protein [uncultured Acetobacter sp.]